MNQVSESGFNFNDNFNHNLYPNQPLDDYSVMYLIHFLIIALFHS